MTAKQVIFGEPAHERLVRGMNILADAVRVTLAPRPAPWCWSEATARPS